MLIIDLNIITIAMVAMVAMGSHSFKEYIQILKSHEYFIKSWLPMATMATDFIFLLCL